jgi:hypothetical protein
MAFGEQPEASSAESKPRVVERKTRTKTMFVRREQIREISERRDMKRK